MRILDIDNADPTNEEIKAAYKKIALKTHPDKLVNLDDSERISKEEQFKKATSAYEHLINGTDFDDMMNQFYSMNEDDMMDFFSSTMTDLASEIYNKYNKNGKLNNMLKSFSMFSNLMPEGAVPGGTQNKAFDMFFNTQEEEQSEDTVPMDINVRCSYSDVLHAKTKKISIEINKEVFNIQIDCANFPIQTKFISSKGKTIEVTVNLRFKHKKECSHFSHADGTIDLIRNIYITPYQYYKGTGMKFQHYTGIVDVLIKAEDDSDIVIPEGGIFGGSLILKVLVKQPNKKDLKEKLIPQEYTTFMELIRKISKSI